MLLRRVVDLRAALKLGFRLSLADVRADEFATMLIIEEETAFLPCTIHYSADSKSR
jgi:hypothetical protein